MIQLLWVMVGYSGWNAATYVAEELKQPERTLPAALAIGTGLVTALYVGLNMIFIYSTPVQAMKGVVAVGKLAAGNLFGPPRRRPVQRADGDLHHVDGERHGDHRTARVLRHGQERRIRQSGGPRASRAGIRPWSRS